MATQIVEMTGDEAKLFRSLDRIIQKEADHRKALENVGNAGADAGDKIAGGIDKAGKKNDTVSKAGEKNWRDFSDKSTASVESFTKKAVASFGAAAASYVGIQAGVKVVNEILETQSELYDQILQKQISLAGSQQEAFKNLAGLSEADRIGLIDQAPDIARKTGFANIGLITQAAGAAVSAGGDRSAAESAVTAAALLTVHTPDAIDDLAAAAIDLNRATGSSDARENLGLLNLAGTQARVVDPIALAQTLSPALVSAVNSVPNQNKAEASRQAASLFAAFGRQTADPTGKSTSTATTQFTAELGKFFGDLEQQRIDARSKIELIDRKPSPTEAQTTERARLTAFVEQTDTFKDPASLFGRVEALQQNPAIKNQFFSKEFGEVAFKGAFKAIADSASPLASELKESFEIIQLDRKSFEKQVSEIGGATGSLRVAGLESSFRADSEASKVENEIGAMRGLVRQQSEDLLKETRGSGTGWILDTMFREYKAELNLPGDSVAAEAFSALDRTIGRQGFLSRGGVSVEDQPAFEQAAGGVGTFRTAILEAVKLDPESLPELERIGRSNIINSYGANPTIRNAEGELTEVDRKSYLQGILTEAAAIARESLAEQKKMRLEMEAARRASEATAANTSAPQQSDPVNYGDTQRGRDQ